MPQRRMSAVVVAVAALVLTAPSAAAALDGPAAPGGPGCPDRAPEGSEFVRTVQPPFGLAYDQYRMPDGGLVSVYC